MNNTTFINQNSERNIYEAGRNSLINRSADLRYYMEVGFNEDEDELRDYINNPHNSLSFGEIRDLINQRNDLGNFFDYGLCFDYVELGTFNDQEEDYFRFQISWGGPSEEIRFYENGTIEYVYLDWFSGVGFDVTREDWADWLSNFYQGADMLNFQEKREGYDYYEQLALAEYPDEDETEDENE